MDVEREYDQVLVSERADVLAAAMTAGTVDLPKGVRERVVVTAAARAAVDAARGLGLSSSAAQQEIEAAVRETLYLGPRS